MVDKDRKDELPNDDELEELPESREADADELDVVVTEAGADDEVDLVIADEGEGSEAEAAAHEARALTSRRSRGPFLSRPLQPREQSRACPRRPSSSPVLSPPSLPPPTLL